MSVIPQSLKRCRLILLSLMLCLSVAAADETGVATVKDWRLLQQQMESTGLPVLLLFTAEDCDYCEAIRRYYLIPMIESGDYQSRILIRQVYVEDYNYLRDVQGKIVGGDQIALQYDVEVTPTILFLDAQGRELTDRIIGLSSPDFFDERLKNSIQRASK